jgi:hypothetical protein
MKLRIHGDSLRLRLNRSDVEQFRISGVCAASFRFDSSSQLTYTFETSSRLTVMEVQYLRNCIRVLLPLDMAQEWACSDRISLSLNRAGGLSLLIEKDFQCLHRDEIRTRPTIWMHFRIPQDRSGFGECRRLTRRRKCVRG